MNYLTATDPAAILGMKIKPKPDWATHTCPACRGYGGWHLLVDAYGPGEHFDCHCSQCNGWGWVTKENADCIHEFIYTKNLGRCFNRYTCSKCGQERDIDSSD